MYNPEEIIRKSKQVARECALGGCKYDHVLIDSLCYQVRELCGKLNNIEKYIDSQHEKEKERRVFLKQKSEKISDDMDMIYKQAEEDRFNVAKDFATFNWFKSSEGWHKRSADSKEFLDKIKTGSMADLIESIGYKKTLEIIQVLSANRELNEN